MATTPETLNNPPVAVELRPAEEPGGLAELALALAAILADACVVDAPAASVLPSRSRPRRTKKQKAA